MRGNALSLALKNILHKKFNYLKISLGFFMVFFIIFVIAVYSQSLSMGYNKYVNEKMHNNSIRVFGDIPDCEQTKTLKSLPQVKSIYSACSLSIDIEEGFNIDGTKYIEHEKLNSTLFSLIDTESDCTIRENAQISFQEDYNEKLIIYGTDVKSNDDILINEEFFDAYGIKDMEATVGKYISFISIGLKFNGRICGIVNKNFQYKGNSYSDNALIIANRAQKSIIEDIESKSEDIKYYIDLKEFFTNEPVEKKLKELMGEEVNYTYFGDYFEEYIEILLAQEELCKNFFSIVSLGLAVIVTLFLIINQSYFLQQNKRFYGIMRASGISNKKLVAVCLLEILAVTIFSQLLAAAVGIATFYAIKEILVMIVSVNLQFAWVGVAIFVGIALSFDLLLITIMAMVVRSAVLNKTPITLLKGK